jgi:hypothetical protein
MVEKKFNVAAFLLYAQMARPFLWFQGFSSSTRLVTTMPLSFAWWILISGPPSLFLVGIPLPSGVGVTHAGRASGVLYWYEMK